MVSARLPQPRAAVGGWVLRRSIAVPVLLMVAVVVSGLIVVSPRTAILGCLVATLAGCVWARPAMAAYLIIGLTPLTAGIDRGLAVPVVRPNEALALVVGGTLAVRGIVRMRTGYRPTFRLNRVELSMALMAVASSLVPIAWMMVRQEEVTRDDVLHALVLWKFLGLYLIVRTSVVTERQVRRCLWLSVAAACIVAVIAILQALQLFGVPSLLATWYAPFGNMGALDNARGGSTLALPGATADLMIYNLAIVSGLLTRGSRHRVMLAGVAALFILAALSAGEFSSALGLLVGAVCIAAVTGSPKPLFAFVPVAAAAPVILRPVIDRRLSGFHSVSGLPVSWTGRLHNLRSHFWPKLFSDWNFLLGVRPSARIPVASQATGYVWIESGYTWLLWGGGIPLLATFVFFVHAAVRQAWNAVHRCRDASSIAGIGAFVAVVVTTVLMIFDPHLTYRGSADELFFLLALAWPRTPVSTPHAEVNQ
jgi:hypothetical protein